MRILIAHQALAGGGGVESYLAALMPALLARGHQLAFLHYDPRSATGPTRLALAGMPSAGVVDDGLSGAMDRMRAWRPDVCFSHNMGPLDVETALVEEWPTVKMMHGYFGTCLSGQKSHAFPSLEPCDRRFGTACLALYLPRHCGQLRPAVMLQQYRWAVRQRTLFNQYAHLVVASEHMAREYGRNGVPANRLTTAPLFPTAGQAPAPRPLPAEACVLFLGRMTALKGGDVLVRAAVAANRRMPRPLRLLFAGTGPAEHEWRALAARLGIDAEFTGWVTGPARTSLFRRASIVAVPSLWPEPFGLAGLEAASHGVPAVAFDVGGVRQWLKDDVNGRLVAPAGDAGAFGEAMASMLGSPATLLRLGDGALQVSAGYGMDGHLDTLEGVFSRAVQAARVLA